MIALCDTNIRQARIYISSNNTFFTGKIDVGAYRKNTCTDRGKYIAEKCISEFRKEQRNNKILDNNY